MAEHDCSFVDERAETLEGNSIYSLLGATLDSPGNSPDPDERLLLGEIDRTLSFRASRPAMVISADNVWKGLFPGNKVSSLENRHA